MNWKKLLFKRNQTHFSQAATDQTPFTVDPLYSLFGYTTDTDFGDKFRNGDIDLDLLDLDEDVFSLLEELLPKQDDLT